ncbi:uncharacterized protein [Panulirus ornatus]|uniref:uncharacterized protein isoform X3 n=1 Tax=Panulirus ornatus TaxID=150431 RepID=UPI003A8B1E41
MSRDTGTIVNGVTTHSLVGATLALLAGTLKTFQRHACDDTSLTLQCPNTTTIDITFARYGRPRQAEGGEAGHDPCPPLAPHSHTQPKAACHYPQEVDYRTLQLVVNKCQHEMQCKIHVMPDTFINTDPCPYTRKYIEVAYKCRPETFINKIVCEYGELTLQCEKNSRLAIYNVLFGRSLSEFFTCPQPTGVPDEDCQASYANEIVMKLCHGHRQCHLKADPEVFGSPCSPDSNMYLKTAYTCVPRKILKTTSPAEKDEDEEEEEEEFKEESLMSPAALPPASHPDLPDPFSPASHPQQTQTPNLFYNPTVTTKLSDKKSDRVYPPVRDYPQDGIPRSQPDLINCTVTILSGSRDREIGFLTEWMRAVAFIKRNFEKFILYLMVGLCVGLLLFLFVVVGRLLVERHHAKKEAKMMHDPLTSVFATDIDDIDGDLDMSGAAGSTLGRSPSPQEPTQEVVRYNTTRPGIRRQDSDTNPRSLSRNNNNQFLYS